jgi:Domain of unknown function (DUF1918)
MKASVGDRIDIRGKHVDEGGRHGEIVGNSPALSGPGRYARSSSRPGLRYSQASRKAANERGWAGQPTLLTDAYERCLTCWAI